MIPQNASQASGTPLPQLPELPPGPSLDSMRGPIEVSTFEPWQLIAIIVVALLVLGFFAWQLIAYLRYRRAQKPAMTPKEVAENRLKEAQSISEDGDFAYAHSDAFRSYLDQVLKSNIKGWTTGELCGELTTHIPINGKEVGTFLNTCDRIKFARATLSEDERIQLTDTTSDLIESIEEARQRRVETGGAQR